jgi:uncharacterized membrane-anchored protein YjiN (DUF445 family)
LDSDIARDQNHGQILSRGGRVAKDVVDPRLSELRRMRMIATLLLVVMTAIFLACSLTQLPWPWIPYVRAFAEAAMIGACADWFAVVALFRRPFGLPIPHTAVVPNNKKRIGTALGRFITNNFLSTKVADERLARIDIVSWAARWIEDPINSARLGQWAARLLPEAIHQVPANELGEFLGLAAQRGIKSIPAAPLASRVLAILWAQGAAQILFDQGLAFGEASLMRHKDFISRKVAEQSSRWVPKWLDDKVTNKVMNGLLATMREMHDPDHPWRAEVHAAVDKLITDLANDPKLYAQGEALKTELLANPVFLDQVKQLWTEIDGELHADLTNFSKMTADLLTTALRGLGKWLDENPDRRAKLNRQIRLVALRILLPRRAEIGNYIAHVVDNWDIATLVNRLELQVGKDLQYIRINGTLVGGFVGLLIFSVSRLFAHH